MKFLADPPRFLFFTGKGGVGKTSVACASAIELAERGRRVLLVSTDPASNIGQVFGLTIGNTVTPIGAIAGLSALEIDPEQAADAYRERIIAPVRGLLPERELASIAEGLSGSCTTEVASFDEFTNLLTDDGLLTTYDHIVFDTAPTGHTIRLLQLPGSWTEFLDAGKGDPSCLGPLSGLDKHKAVYAAAVAALADPERTRLVLVARAQASALTEIERTHAELAQIGIRGSYVVINGVLPASAGTEPIAVAVRNRESAALTGIPAAIAALPRDILELKAGNMMGIDALRTLFRTDRDGPGQLHAVVDVPDAPLGQFVDELEQTGHGLILCMGKGGVGKTTIAVALAVALAERGHAVHLTTTDPAAHLVETLHGSLPGLRVSRIDPDEAIRDYREHVMATKGKNLDADGRAALAEDLLSPCTDEVAVFRQFSQAVHESRHEFVVVDTAPTGHTLLLLDATGSYHREIARQMGDGMAFVTPLMRLQDPALTKVLLVTLAETTPVLEAEGLQQDLQRAGIQPWGWVVNNSIAAAHPETPFLQARAASEATQIDIVVARADRVAIVPLLADEPIGVDRLAALTALATVS
ncbi:MULTISPECIES: arsenical pump-driving ATPase [Cryobacterium]|uniref:Arsenite-transporting ATPase n=1 Tax=Cryobacterium levicorallinum TaxID=995038 RepID=A0ABY1EC78_9MICO|nr:MULTISPECIES: arsenical pump-driving ATPase [Cryobacterium]TFD56497.1 arsenical pump-driving ATPase [Cryobacterium sp. Hh38]GEP26028.1 arsenical pump-driving ATPase [Cryobacterium levicorallinum]SFH40386.1 arsenite-transporting ATPase [Cryobacterium levicorallinum]